MSFTKESMKNLNKVSGGMETDDRVRLDCPVCGKYWFLQRPEHPKNEKGGDPVTMFCPSCGAAVRSGTQELNKKN